MSTCHYCKQELEENAAVCKNCGRKQKNRSKIKWENRPLTPEEQDRQDKKYLFILALILIILVYATIRQFLF
jgi:uncharacterized membrane protein YvbJ